MVDHKFPNALLAVCDTCGVKRMKKRGEFFYAASVEGPWENVAPPCVEPRPMKSWRDKTIIMFDVETTGLDWTTDSVTEVGIVVGRLDANAEHGVRILEKQQSLVRPTVMPRRQDYEKIEAITHIAYDDLADAPLIDAVCTDIFLLAAAHEDSIAAAYNFDFDHPFIAGAMFARAGMCPPNILRAPAPKLDPYRWIQKRDKYVPSRVNNKGEKIGRHKLTETAARYGLIEVAADGEVQADGAHRADYDAEIALRILAKLAPEMPADLDDVIDYQLASEKEWANNFFGVYLPNKRRQERALARIEAAELARAGASEQE